MVLNDKLVFAFGERGCSKVRIYCGESIRQDVAEAFTEILHEEYETVLDMIEEETSECYEREKEIYPFGAPAMIPNGLEIDCDLLALHIDEGESFAPYDGCDVLENALKRLRNQFPEIEYDGYLGYYDNDSWDYIEVQREITSGDDENDNKKIYDYVGAALAEAFHGEAAWGWDVLRKEVADWEYSDVANVLENFRNYECILGADVVDRYLTLIASTNPEFIPKLEEAYRKIN